MSAIDVLTGIGRPPSRGAGAAPPPLRGGTGGVSDATREPKVPAASPVAWAPADRGLWVASDADGFVGTVEEIGERYVALDGFGIEIGRTDSLIAAQELVTSPLGRGYAKRRRENIVVSRLTLATAVVAGSSSLAIGAALVFLVAR